jgi:hypothetical protein
MPELSPEGEAIAAYGAATMAAVKILVISRAHSKIERFRQSSPPGQVLGFCRAPSIWICGTARSRRRQSASHAPPAHPDSKSLPTDVPRTPSSAPCSLADQVASQEFLAAYTARKRELRSRAFVEVNRVPTRQVRH